MALTSIIRDFAVRSGLIVEGTNVVTSSTGMTGTLQVNGGAAIEKNLIVGSTIDIFSDSLLRSQLTVQGQSYVAGVTATGIVSITTNTQANLVGAGALSVTGGAYIGSNLVVKSSAASTTTVASNALYVEGGVGINGSLYVSGPAIFDNDVIFTGETTYVYSTNTVYTDNFIDLHVPGSSTSTWSTDDGKDIGFIFNYYNGGDKNGFLGLAQDTNYLEWYSDGLQTIQGTFTNAVYGTFKTGSAILVDTTNATNSTTGALQVAGGIGVGSAVNAGTVSARNLTSGRIVLAGDGGQLIDDAQLYYNTLTNQISGTIDVSNTATNLAGGATGSIPYQSNPGLTTFLPIGQAGLILFSNGSTPYWTTTGTLTAGAALTATNLLLGQQYQIPYQTAPGSTSFEDNFKYFYDTDTFQTVNGRFTGTTNATSTITGALQVVGGLGVGNSLFVGGNATIVADLFVNGGDFNTNQTTFNLLNSTATTVNLAGAGTAITIGATTGYTVIRNLTTLTNATQATSTITGALRVAGGVGIGGNVYSGGDGVFAGDLAVNGGDLTSTAATFNLLNSGVTTANVLGAGTAITIGATTGYTTIRNLTTITNTTDATSTITGALRVAGGVGIGGNVYVGSNGVFTGDLAVNGGDLTSTAATFNLLNSGVATANILSFGTAINISSSTGYTTIRNLTTITDTTNAVSTITGALTVAGGVGAGKDIWVGGNGTVVGDLAVNGGDLTSTAATFNLLNSGVTTANVLGAGTAITIGAVTGATTVRNKLSVTSSTFATSADTGALVVTGGVGVSGNVWINDALRVVGQTTLANVTASLTTASSLVVTNNATVGGVLSVTDSQNANAINNGAVRITGGVGIVKDVVMGGAITVGVTAAATSATVVPAVYSNNLLLASYTSGYITGSTQVDLDTFSSSVYRSAKYFIQITDGSNVHVSEISLFHDGVKAYLNEYGIATNNGQLGVFDASYGANVTMKFTPNSASTMTIKVVRMTITS